MARQALDQIEEEADEEERKNRTRNPMPEGMDILINEMREKEDEERNINVLTAWSKEMEDKIWINAKTSNSIEFQLQHGEWKEGLSLEEQIPQKSGRL